MVVVNMVEEPSLDLKLPGRYSLRRTRARVQLHEAEAKISPPPPAKIKRAASASSPASKKMDTRSVKKCKTENAAPAATASVVADGGHANDGGEDSTVATVEKSASAKVIETLRKFNKYYLNFIQAEEKRCGTQEAEKADLKSSTKKGSKSKSKKAVTTEDCAKKTKAKRPDLKATSEMMKTKAILYPEKIIGSIPGIDVGHQFFSRAEMVVVGFHQHWLNGIDFIGKNANSSRKSGGLDLKKYKLPITISIVMSGQYEDDLDNCEDVVYTGQGGNNLLGDKRQIRDQELKRGNLGLKNCMEQSVPVRVVRGHKCQNSYVGKVYTYDGLYRVTDYWAEKGVSGFTVYKFRLKRLDGQPPLTTKEVYFTRGRIPKSLSEIRGLVCEDISQGLENIRIPVTNLVDDPPIPPEGFAYIKSLKFSKNVNSPTIAPVGCGCHGSCTDPRKCACAKLNGGDFPYVHKDGGRLVEPAGVVFECGPNCGCGPGCVNRISQIGLRFRLEVFRTPKKGWGVRSWDYIPSGAPICEYIGLLRKTSDLSTAAENSYVFDIDCLQTMKGLSGRESRLRDVPLPSHLKEFVDETSDTVPFCIDAGQTGNLARFINHSCQPNLFVQCVLSNHHDMRYARVMLVAADNIPPLKELTYDYGYELDTVMDTDGKVKQMACFCGAAECRKRLF